MLRPLHLSALLVVCGFASAQRTHSAAPGGAPAPGSFLRGTSLQNTLLPSRDLQQVGHLTFTNVPEQTVDLNGDGDTLDEVTHVFDGRTGLATNLRLAVLRAGGLIVAGDTVLLRASEVAQGADLDGDGDKNGIVPLLYDHRTSSVVDLRWEGVAQLSADGAIAGVNIFERDHGSIDLNGDGDSLDYVVQLYDVDRRIAYDTRRAGTLAGFGPGLAFLYVSEAGQRVDANADGDLSDQVLHLFDMRFGQLVQTRLGWGYAQPQGDEDHVVCLVLESQQGVDLNGDGDLLDQVLHVVDRPSFTTRNLAIAGSFNFQDFLTLHEGKAYLGVGERDQGGVDLNGDGDVRDSVLHEIDLASGAARNLGVVGTIVTVRPDGLLFLALFEGLEGIDYDGDGDAQDIVPALLDPASATLTAFAMPFQTFQGSYVPPAVSPLGDVAWLVPEDQTGDRNGDGDALDLVLHSLPHATTTPFFVVVAAHPVDVPRFSGEVLHFLADEQAHGGADINGDGDSNDTIVFLHDASTLSSRNTMLAGLGHALFGRNLAVGLAEFQVGQDLNGDGDQVDLVAHVLRLP